MKLKRYGGFLKWGYPQIIRFNRLFHYKQSICGYHHLWKPPYSIHAAAGFSCHPSLCDFGAMRCPPLWPQQHEQHVAVYPAKGRSKISDVLIDQQRFPIPRMDSDNPQYTSMYWIYNIISYNHLVCNHQPTGVLSTAQICCFFLSL